jgi:ribosomal protein S18 acetylase RimI-like enzyme
VEADGYRVVPYDRARHGDGPWRVVAAVFEEYGFPFAEADYDADVLRPEAHYPTGWFLVAESPAGEVVGCIGLTDEGGGEFELHRLYLLPAARGKGLGERLTREVVRMAREAGARRLVLFSDVAFEHAHRLYERCGFRRNRFRYAPDPWQSREWGFVMEFEEHGKEGR